MWYGVTKAACLHVKEDFSGKEKDVRSPFSLFRRPLAQR